jgi:hypothetical protein
MTARATWADIEKVAPNNYGPGGGYRIFCPGGCDMARGLGYVPVWGHRYAYGYTKTTALESWRESHPRGGGK